MKKDRVSSFETKFFKNTLKKKYKKVTMKLFYKRLSWNNKKIYRRINNNQDIITKFNTSFKDYNKLI